MDGEQQVVRASKVPGEAMLLPTPKNLAARLVPVPNKRLPPDFKSAVALLKRPYFRLSTEAYALVLLVAGDSDIVLHDGRQMTYGDADGGKALMPLSRPI